MFPYAAGTRMRHATFLAPNVTSVERRLELLPTQPRNLEAGMHFDRSYAHDMSSPSVVDKIIDSFVRERESAMMAEQEAFQLQDFMNRSILQRLVSDLGLAQQPLMQRVFVPLSPLTTFPNVIPQALIHQRTPYVLQDDVQEVYNASKGVSERTQFQNPGIQDLQRGRQEQQRPPQRATISERKTLKLTSNCPTPKEALRVLTALGSTLRSKCDPFIDTIEIQDPGLKLAPITPRRGTSEFFPDKLYHMLQDVERLGMTDVVSFLPHGRAFRVHKPERFVNAIMPKYFSNLGKWSSFSRQCNLWGFLRVTAGCDENAYYHELFVRSHPDLCRFLRRVGIPHGLDRRKHKLPEGSDPDFWAMSPAPEFEATSSGHHAGLSS